VGTSTQLRQELKRRFGPLLDSQGFTRDESEAPLFVTFRKHTPESTQVIYVQWDKYGKPRFVVGFGQCPAAGIEFRGQRIPRETMLAGWCKGGRLQPRSGSSTRSWFRLDADLIMRLRGKKSRRPSEVVDELLAQFPEVEAWWKDGSIGKHLRLGG
jgi:hypothetical protein